MKSKTRIRWMAFLLPLVILLIIYIAQHVYPFGDRCILHIDMYHQYAPFYAELQEKLKTLGSPLFSWNIGIGSDFLATYAYYLASPLNILLGLFPRENLIEAMTFFISIKIAVASLSECLYLEHRMGKAHISFLIPSLFYAFSGFICAYYWDIMWLDAVALFPLIILGMEKLVKEGKCGLYILTLTLSIWSNYYISIMICIFLVIWFFLMLFELCPAGKRLKALGKMALSSVLSAGVSAVLILPEIAILGISGSGNNHFPTELSYYYNPLEGLSRGFFGLEVTTTEGKLPNIYCGVFVIILMLLFALNRRIGWKKKLSRLLLLVFLQLSFGTNLLEYLWHGCHFPEGLPARQSFIYVFVLLLVGTEAFFELAGQKSSDILIAGVASVSLTAVLWALVPEEVFPADKAVISVIFLGAYILLVLMYRGRKVATRALAMLLLLVVSVAEVSANFALTGFSTTGRGSYTGDIKATRDLITAQREEDPTFWRVEKYERMMKDENMLSAYPSASLFSSLINIDVADAYHSVGMEGGKNYYCYNGATPLFSAMLQVKYMLTDSPEDESPYKALLREEDGVYLYENTYSLPLGFLTDKDLEEKWNRADQSYVGAVNEFGRALGVEEDILQYGGEGEQKGDKTVVQATEDGLIFADMKNNDVSRVFVKRDDVETEYSKTTHHYFLELGYLHEGEKASVRGSNGETLDLSWYRVDREALDRAFQKLNSSVLNVEKWKDTVVKGTINADRDGRLVLGIPKESGWIVEVDGKLKESETFMDSYIAIPIQVGYHEINLKYRTPWLPQGAGISAGCLTALVLWGITESRKRRNGKKRKDSYGVAAGGGDRPEPAGADDKGE